MLRLSTMGWQERQAAVPVLLLSAFIALAVGTAVYVLDRDWSAVLFLAPLADWQPDAAGIFGPVGHSLPSLTHAYAFTLMLILGLGPWRRSRQVGALSWLVIACALECMQGANRASLIDSGSSSQVVGWFSQFTVNGRFDAVDIAATAIGVFAAYHVSAVLEARQ